MSTARAISASRQRTGSRSPRRAWAVRSTPTRSSSALPPESNSPSNGSPIRSPRPQEPQIPVDDGVAEHEHDRRAHGEEYPERDVTLLAPEQEWHVHQAAEHRRREHRQQHALPPDERAHHRHHLDVAASHCLFPQHPASHDADRVQQREPGGGAEHRVLEPRHSRRERGAEPDDETGPVVLVGDQVVAGVGDGDPEEDRPEQRGGEEMHGRSVGGHRRDPQHAYHRLDDRVPPRDRLAAAPAAPSLPTMTAIGPEPPARTARGSGSPSAAVAHSVTSCWRAQAMNAASSNGTTGWRNVAPIAARNALGLSVSAVPRSTMVPAAPRAWAVRISVPTFPGSWTPSMTNAAVCSPPRRMSPGTQLRGSTTATIPCGASVSATCASARAEPSSTETACRSRSTTRPPPPVVRATSGATSAPRKVRPAASASSTRRTPSISASPRRPRALRR